MKSRYIKISITIIGLVGSIIGIKTYVFDKSPQEAIAPVKKDTERIIQLIEKGIEPKQQLIDELEKKNQELEKALLERTRTTKDKRAEEALVAFKAGNNEKARELFETLREEGEGGLAKTNYNLGNVYFVDLDFQKALEAYLDAVRLAPDNSTYLNEAGYSFQTLAQYDRAIEYYEKALESDLKTLGEDHPDVAIDWDNLGSAWKAKGEYDKAIEYHEKALKVFIKTFGEDHPDVAIDWNNLGSAWKAKGEYDKAIEYYEKALKSDIKTFGEDHPDVATRWNNLGSAWDAKGEYDKAIEYYEKALSVFRIKLGNDHPRTKSTKTSLDIVKKEKLEILETNREIETEEPADTTPPKPSTGLQIE
ncbi:MAG: tetratricopeptide repeat protein [Candidatus Scalindua sediminis]|nr:tetratricopeptide repeat protein [Candidatus Scalindua sediminis]